MVASTSISTWTKSYSSRQQPVPLGGSLYFLLGFLSHLLTLSLPPISIQTCKRTLRTHLSWSSGLDGMPLTFDAFWECSVLGHVCLDKWARLSALHVIASWLELHMLTPGPDRLGIRAGLSAGLSNPWSKSSLAFYSHIVTLGIREQRKASFSPYPHRFEFWVTLIISTGW